MTPEACRARITLHAQMAALNPKGWRKPRTAKRYRKLPAGQTRISSMTTLGKLAGKAGVLAYVKRAVGL